MPKSVLDFDKRGGGTKVRSLPNQNAQRLEQAAHALITKTGWDNTPGVTLSFTDGSRTFTITPDSTTFDYWILGVKYTKSVAETVVITDTEGLWFIYYVGSTLIASQTPWENRDADKAMVAIVYWDATSNHHHYLGNELHPFEMSPNEHDKEHHTVGTAYSFGLGLVAGTGGNDGKVAMDAGIIWDESIEISITDGSGGGLFEQELGNTSVFAAAQIPVYYRSGASDWEKYTAGDFPFYDNATVDNVHYNSYSAPNWASTAASSSAKWIAMWIFGTNNQTEPVIAIMGQIESNTLNAAKDVNTLQSIDLGTLPFSEMKVLYRLIFKSDSTYAHTEDLRSTNNIPGGTYVPLTHPIHDDVFGADWDGETTIAPSQNAIYDAMKDENDMISDSDVHWASQQSIKAYVDAAVIEGGGPGSDTTAIHEDEANEITNITNKGSLVGADEFIIEDSGASYVKKAVLFSILEGALSLANLGNRDHANLQNKNAETDIKHLTDAQLSALHTLYTLEAHKTTHQNSGGDEIDVGGLSGLLADGQTPVSHNNTYHSTNYHTEAAGTGVATVHSDIASVGSQSIITTAERNALHAESHNIVDHDTTATGANLNTLVGAGDTTLHKHDGQYYTETEMDNRVFEKNSTFPGSPTEGDLHYDTVDEAMYRYSGDAQAWIQIGGSGVGSGDIHDEAHDHDGDTLLNDGITPSAAFTIDGASTITIDAASVLSLISASTIRLKPSAEADDYIEFIASSNIPHLKTVGGDDFYFKIPAGNWQIIHADAFTEHSEPLPTGNSTDKLLNVKNINEKLDHNSLPIEAYFIDKNNENEGMKLGAMVMHLVKTIQELENRIKTLEGI